MSETTPQSKPHTNHAFRLAVIADIHGMLPSLKTVMAKIWKTYRLRTSSRAISAAAPTRILDHRIRRNQGD